MFTKLKLISRLIQYRILRFSTIEMQQIKKSNVISYFKMSYNKIK